MGDVKRGLHIFSKVGIELPGAENFGSIIRAHESDIERMVEGTNVNANIALAREMYDQHNITVEINGAHVAIKAVLSHLLRKGKEAYDICAMHWPASNSSFVRFMEQLWDEEKWRVYGRPFDMESQKFSVEERPDITYMLVGDKIGMPNRKFPRKARDAHRVTASELHKMPAFAGGGDGGFCGVFVLGDSTVITEHDEDGKPMYDVDLAAEEGE